MKAATFQDNILKLQANLLNFALMLTSNRDDAYDLLQDTTLKALDNQDKYCESANFKGWMFTIMRNIFINNYRHTRCMASTAMADDPIFEISISNETPVEMPEETMFANEICEAIASFSPELSEPFAMHIAGFYYQEIAEHMNIPIGTVKSRIFSARQQLQRQFADYR